MRLRESKDKRTTRKIKIQIYVSPVDHKLLVEDAEKCGITVSELVRSLVRSHYDDKLDRA